jgi:hypothetical protein
VKFLTNIYWIKVRTTAGSVRSSIPMGFIFGPLRSDDLPPLLDGSWELCDGHVCYDPEYCEWAADWDPTLRKRIIGWLRGGTPKGWPYGKADGGSRVPDLRVRVRIGQ